MKRPTIDIQEKIAVCAYYRWLDGSTAGADADWLAAEQIEQAYAERRVAAARKAAETRRANALTKPPRALPIAARGRAKASTPSLTPAH